MTQPIERVLAALRASGHEPQKSGKGWCCRCPAHEDSRASLSISEGHESRALLFCHAGCSFRDVLSAIGLQPRDTYMGPSRERTARPAKSSPAPVRAARDWGALSERFTAAATDAAVNELAEDLHVSTPALRSIGIGFATAADLKYLCTPKDAARGAWTFPMRDHRGEVIGIFARCIATMEKKILAKSKSGLFMPVTLERLPDPVYVVEGASDTAAALTIGWTAVGRPSAKGGVDHLKALLTHRKVVIVGENDCKPNGHWPGREGARDVRRKLGAAWGVAPAIVMPPPGQKDLREWVAKLRAESAGNA